VYVQTGKTFIATLIAVALALGGLAWMSSRGGQKDVSSALAQTQGIAQTSAIQPLAASESSADNTNPNPNATNYEDGYRAGYRDGHQDCGPARNTAVARRASGRYRSYAPRTRVAGARYYAEPHRGHSTRNMLLTIAAPAAIGAGIGAIAHGGKGAGIGALLGGGGGALYHLYRNRRR